MSIGMSMSFELNSMQQAHREKMMHGWLHVERQDAAWLIAFTIGRASGWWSLFGFSWSAEWNARCSRMTFPAR